MTQDQRLLDDYTYEKLNDCVHCGFCLPYCPTYQVLKVEADSPRGRIHLMKAFANGEIGISDGLLDHISLCLICRNCETVCPSGVRFGWAMDVTRQKIEEMIQRTRRERISRWLFFSLFDRLSRLRLAFRFLNIYRKPFFRTILRGLGVDKFLMMANPDSVKNSEKFLNPRGEIFSALGEKKFRVGFLVGCIMGTLLSDIDRATIRVLNRNGCDVIICKEQECCGALQIHEGEMERSIRLAKRNIDAFSKYELDAIIVNSAGCGAQMKEYGELLRNDRVYSEKANLFSVKVRDFAEFLSNMQLNTNFGSLRMKVTYQDPCHLVHGQGIRNEPREILGKIPGIELVEMENADQCCGAAGIYASLHPEMSDKILLSKMEYARATGAEVIIASNPPCIFQYGMGLEKSRPDMRVLHLAEVLDIAYSNGSEYSTKLIESFKPT